MPQKAQKEKDKTLEPEEQKSFYIGNALNSTIFLLAFGAFQFRKMRKVGLG